jgi:hypothetical protein
MSEKRYFYADPLAAAWMARHFGMRFLHHPSGVLEEVEVMGRTCNYVRVPLWPKFHLHPDSLPVLEPREGDVVSKSPVVYGAAAVIVSQIWTHESGQKWIVFSDGWQSEFPGITSILKRDGILFHWPECEAA